jgi:hypothetical protein
VFYVCSGKHKQREQAVTVAEHLEKARDFIIRNGRLLERRLFAFHFDGADGGPVVQALAPYQNADGGFGWGLEPDKRDPASQPQDAQFALEVLEAVGALDADIVPRLCDWLETVTTGEGGVPFALPSLNAHPHAPWWGVKEDQPPANINPTAAITGLLLKAGVRHPWLERATDFCWRTIETVETREFHDLMPIITFLEQAGDRPRAERALARIAGIVSTPGVVALEPDAEGYVQKPLDWAPFPDGFCRRLFDDAVIERHLAALAGRQGEDGAWPISWPSISPGVELEWRGIATIKALRTLHAYDFDR